MVGKLSDTIEYLSTALSTPDLAWFTSRQLPLLTVRD